MQELGALQQLGTLKPRREPVAAQVFDFLRTAIVERRLEPGAPVSETELARILNVSKTPVREAMLRLKQLHLVSGEGRMLRVIEPSQQLIRDTYELRLAVELQAAQFAAERATAAEIDHIAELADSAKRAAEANFAEQFRSGDVLFHQAVAAAAHSPLLEEQVRNAIFQADVLRQRDAPLTAVSQQCATDHLVMAEYLRGKQVDDLISLMRLHIMTVMERVLHSARDHLDDHPPSIDRDIP